jgi:hypothetical protein
MAVDEHVDEMLYSAIGNKRLLRFRYKASLRVVEPHDYGIQKGIARLLCWQVGGKSSGRIPGWRWIDVEGIEACEMLERSFPGRREVQSGEHHQWDKVFIRVASPTETKR